MVVGKEPNISELNELFGAEGYEPFEVEWQEDIKETEEGWQKLNYLLNAKTEFTQDYLQEELGIRFMTNQLPTFKLFVCNFWEYDKAIGFSFGNNPHPPKAWNPHEITYSTIQGVIKRLDEAKLIKFTKGTPSKHKKFRTLSTASPSDAFMKWIVANLDDVFVDCSTHVRLNMAGKKHLILPYEPTTYTKKVDSIMKRYHKKLKEWELKIDGVALDNLHLFVSFQAVKDQKDKQGNYLIRHGGRWYGAWNQLSSDTRLKQLSFKDGGELMEVDYQASGCNALSLWETGQWLPKDPFSWVGSWLWSKNFAVDGLSEKEMREYIKKVIHISINASGSKLKGAIEQKFRKSKRKEFYVGVAKDTIGFFKLYNPEIAHWIAHSELSGRKAMFIESNLVLGVIERFCKADIPVVSIYDSFIFPKKYEKKAKEIIFDKDGLDWVIKLLSKDEQGMLYL